MSHTPGPWKVKYEAMVFSGNRSVANCGGYSSNVDSTKVRNENFSNAVLVSAAPELLAACEALLEYYDTGIDWAYSEGALKDSEYNDAIHKMENAKAAVKKAKGETK